jgi:hypothetical protein
VATPKGAGLQKTNGVEDNFLGVQIWVLFFALLISAAVVGYVIARSTCQGGQVLRTSHGQSKPNDS